ncbi:hypothetical protein OAQ99_03015 [Candidatus Kapabacteria bacterium]|nr:hypothetical protein [Candidatus Kapabacteria bacterium]
MNKILNFYRYLFYRLYSWNLKTWGMVDGPHWNATIGISFMMLANITPLLLIIQLIGPKIFQEDKPVFVLFVIWSSTYLANYLWLVRGGKYLEWTKEYDKEDKTTRTKNTLYLFFYLIASLAVPAYLTVIVGEIHGLR